MVQVRASEPKGGCWLLSFPVGMDSVKVDVLVKASWPQGAWFGHAGQFLVIWMMGVLPEGYNMLTPPA